jgi:hypothetical protein
MFFARIRKGRSTPPLTGNLLIVFITHFPRDVDFDITKILFAVAFRFSPTARYVSVVSVPAAKGW